MQQGYSKQVRRASIFAICTAFLLVIVKGLAWWKTGSVSMLASITDSLLDLLSSFTSMMILRFALMPADDNHSFGHGKAESLASLVQGAFISGSAVFLLLQGIYHVDAPQVLTHSSLGIGVTLFSIFATLVLVLYQTLTIRVTQSPAIKADRLHYQTDLLMNIAILVSLILGNLGFIYADAIFAIMIAVYILCNALKMLFEATQLLLDVALPEEEILQIMAITRHLAQKEKAIIGLHDLKTRRSGGIRCIQLHLELADELSFVKAHSLTDRLERELAQAFPMSDIMIHSEPASVVIMEGKHNPDQF